MASKKTKGKINSKKQKEIKRKRMRLLILVGFMFFLVFAYSKLSNKNEETISVENINYYIQIADKNSKPKEQLNWIEIAAIDNAINNGSFQKSDAAFVDKIANGFYDSENKNAIKGFDKVINDLALTDKEKRTAKKNLEKLKEVSLRSKIEGNNVEKDNFIKGLEEASINNYKNYSILPSITISQAILESEWGNSALAIKYNNYFGIKADKSWKGKIANFKTKENLKDVISANFRAYNSKEESIYDLGKFLKENYRYDKYGLFKGTNYIEQANALENAGYATAKNEQGELVYADRLISIIRENNLMLIDNQVQK
jgi:flagellum-specific peptidoglycan hydrolase FlgJ